MATSTVKTRSCPALWLLLFLIPACATYQPMPLDQTTVAARLATPSTEAIQVQAKGIQHPVLKPIEFEFRNGLSPDEAAILAVIANPKLRATRDQRKLAAAQLLQAGILPNPQFSYALGRSEARRVGKWVRRL